MCAERQGALGIGPAWNSKAGKARLGEAQMGMA